MKIRLELNALEINKHKKRWNIYFVFATEHPQNQDEWVVTVLQTESIIKLRKSADNKISFEPKGNNVEGLFVLEREMPKDKSVKARMWVMHSRNGKREIGEVLQGLSEQLSGNKLAKAVSLLGGAMPWLKISKTALKGVGAIGDVLSELKDKDLGFVNMDEHFSEQNAEEERSNTLSTGDGEVSWSWLIEK